MSPRRRHAERMLRWSSDEALPREHARRGDTTVRLQGWQFSRDAAGGHYQARLADAAAGLDLDLALAPTQPPLLQSQAGHSQKGPQPQQASDADDDHVIAAAVATRAELIVTGDRKHLLPIGTHQVIAIVAAREVVERLDARLKT